MSRRDAIVNLSPAALGTEAGRRLLDRLGNYGPPFHPSDGRRDEFVIAIHAIEYEARQQARTDERVAPEALRAVAEAVWLTGAMRHRLPHPENWRKCAACRLKDAARKALGLPDPRRALLAARLAGQRREERSS